MANEVEEKIVSAKFDSSNFEKGVNKTVKKLDELKALGEVLKDYPDGYTRSDLQVSEYVCLLSSLHNLSSHSW